MSTRACPESWELTRAVAEGMGPALFEHLEGCTACRGQLGLEKDLRVRAQALPRLEPSRAAVLRVQRAVLGAEAKAIARRGPWRLGALAAGLALLVGLGAGTWKLARQPPAPPTQGVSVQVVAPTKTRVAETAVARRKGTVHARAGARLVELGAPGDEVVRLEEGGITVEVEKLATAERFRVVTSDAEVEVRGTAFDVDVVHDRLRAVRVWHGVVEVRPGSGTPVLLHAGEHWTAPSAVAAKGATPSPGPQPALPLKPRSDEDAFNAGWASLRSGDFSQASHAFQDVLTTPDSPLAEDARYWNAVALQRAGRTPEALAAWEAFLQSHPDSERAAEANVAAGWLELGRENAIAARARFQAVGAGASGRVQASAQAGLARCGD